ncbi:MAG: hypothetical protein AAGC67_00490 [Myxococcota bacterium]
MRISAVAHRILSTSLAVAATTVFASASALAQPSPAPVSAEDPLGEGRLVIGSPELVVAQAGSWNPYFPLDSRAQQHLLDAVGSVDTHAMEQPGNTATSGSSRMLPDTLIDVTVGRFLDDDGGRALPRSITAWIGQSNELVLSAPGLNRLSLSLGTFASSLPTGHAFPALATPYRSLAGAYADELRQFRIETGDVDGDGVDETVVAQRNASGQIQVSIYRFQGSDGSAVRTRFLLDEFVFSTVFYASGACSRGPAYAPVGAMAFDVAMTDVDGDGADELAIAFNRAHCDWTGAQGRDEWIQTPSIAIYRDQNPGPSQNWAVEVAPQDVSTPRHAARNRSSGAWTGEVWPRVAIVGADRNGNGREQLLTAATTDDGQVLLTQIEVDTLASPWTATNDGVQYAGPEAACGCDGGPFTVEADDLDRDGDAEIVVYANDELRIFSENPNKDVPATGIEAYLNGLLVERASTTLEPSRLDATSHRVLTFGDPDIDFGDSFAREILVAEALSTASGRAGDLALLRWDGDAAIDFVASQPLPTLAVAEADRAYPVALAAIEVDEDGARLSAPACETAFDVAQPLVIVNAPPIHFDTENRSPADGACVDSSTPGCFDVNACYPAVAGSTCDFTASYIEESTIEVASEVRADWATSRTRTESSGLEGGLQAAEFAYVKASVDEELRRSVGERFEKVSSNASQLELTTTIVASRRDRVLVSEIDYEVCEYEVLGSETNEPLGHVVAVVPGDVSPPSWRALDSVANGALLADRHEAGNLLSYSDGGALSLAALNARPEVASALLVTAPQQVTPGSGDAGGFTVRLATVESEELVRASSQRISSSLSVEGSEGVSGDIANVSASIGVATEGSYEANDMNTHRTTVSDSVEVRVDLGWLDGGFAQGLGAPDYEIQGLVYWDVNGTFVVDYAVDLDVAPVSFWDNYYGAAPDLTFNLPWRQDYAKGISSTLATELERSPDIAVVGGRILPNEPFAVEVRVANRSTREEAYAPVGVRVYLGDPREGGVEVTQPTPVFFDPAARETQVLRIEGLVAPAGYPIPDTRVFVELDPEDRVTEIHEDNNQAWAAFEKDPFADYVPEPRVALGLLIGVAALSALSRRRSGS